MIEEPNSFTISSMLLIETLFVKIIGKINSKKLVFKFILFELLFFSFYIGLFRLSITKKMLESSDLSFFLPSVFTCRSNWLFLSEYSKTNKLITY